jgi:undecaprenyl-diphosphatase
MSIIEAIILGIVQGLTEFLPISSSAHLVLVPFLLNWKLEPNIAFVFNILVQVGTLAGVVAFFWKDLWEILTHFLRGIFQRQPFQTEPARLGWLLILATLPAGVIGLLIKDLVEAAFASPFATAIFLIITAILLVTAELFNKYRVRRGISPRKQAAWQEALIMGFGQALAIFPGISRSGATITAGMLRDLDRPTAARFSFLMSIPVMLAAGVIASLDLLEIGNVLDSAIPITAGFITSAIIGYLSIAWLLRYLIRHSLLIFAIYCAAFGLLNIFVYWLR